MSLNHVDACNITSETLRIDGLEQPIISNITFHQLGVIIAALSSLIAILVSFYLIFMHALHYTKPSEQRHIIRILFMVPIYAVASFLSLAYYWHSIYFQVISDCYEAIAIASFFALLCHYIAPNLHEQKIYFRSVQPMDWVWPLNWFKFCCGMVWRTPRSGLTWFNIIWTGVYQYCFIRIAMTIVAVSTQYIGVFCESSQSPQFAHIWVSVIQGISVTIAMYCIIQFYLQIRNSLSQHRPFLKILAIKLVIFLSFWQSLMVNVLTSSSLSIIKPNAKIAYPDLKIGVPSLLLCIEMAAFSVLHLFAFPYKPYADKYHEDSNHLAPPDVEHKSSHKQGGPLGLNALANAMNPWDLVKSFARAVPWLFVGRKTRESDESYKISTQINDDNKLLEPQPYNKDSNIVLPIAKGFRRSSAFLNQPLANDDSASLIDHAQTPSVHQYVGYIPARQRYDADGYDIPNIYHGNSIGIATSKDDSGIPLTSDSKKAAVFDEKRTDA